MNYEVREAQSFWDCVAALRQDDQFKAALVDTMVELRHQPFHNPKLQTHHVGTALNGLKIYSSDVGGRRSDRRLIWQVFGNTIVVLLYGTHAVQDRAQRMRIDLDAATNSVAVYEQAPDSVQQRPYHEQRTRVGRLMMAWTDAELRSLGFNEPTVAVLRTLDNEDELLALEGQIAAELFEQAFNLYTYGNADGTQVLSPPVVEADAPEPTKVELDVERRLDDPRGGALFTQTEPEYLADILSKPIEDWMIFLHPDQATLVRRHFEGPARVRGAAGTGKTVVGLHRAAHLAARNRADKVERPVLFTTYIRSLPPVFESLYLRMPGTRAGEVEFVHIDKLARDVCVAAGERVTTDARKIDTAYSTAYDRIVASDTPLAQARFSRQYLRDEITAVIKGRAIASLDTYLAIERTGRGAPLGRLQRTQIWRLMHEWDAEMTRRGTLDFADVILRARNHARRLPAARFSAAIIDEAQDLTLAGLQLVRALVNAPDGADPPNGLLLLGDGAQRIYAGGFKLRQAGVEVRGRTTVLKVNYRNTGEILGAAMAVAGDSEIDDLGEEFRRGDEVASCQRHGVKPELIPAGRFEAQLDAIVDQIGELTANGAIGPGDIGILVPTNRLASWTTSRLDAAKLPSQSLDGYDGRPTERVKVGTYHRGKGLEFKVVFLPGLTKGVFPRPPTDGTGSEEAAEARELAVSQLFVAMTRARDRLVVLYDQEPSDVIAGHLDRFTSSHPSATLTR